MDQPMTNPEDQAESIITSAYRAHREIVSAFRWFWLGQVILVQVGMLGVVLTIGVASWMIWLPLLTYAAFRLIDWRYPRDPNSRGPWPF